MNPKKTLAVGVIGTIKLKRKGGKNGENSNF